MYIRCPTFLSILFISFNYRIFSFKIDCLVPRKHMLSRNLPNLHIIITQTHNNLIKISASCLFFYNINSKVIQHLSLDLNLICIFFKGFRKRLFLLFFIYQLMENGDHGVDGVTVPSLQARVFELKKEFVLHRSMVGNRAQAMPPKLKAVQ